MKIVQKFFGRECKPIVARTVAPNVSRGRTTDGRVKVDCLLQFCFLVMSRVRCRFAAPPYHPACPKIFALEELSFNETRREKTPIFIRCVSPAWFTECLLFFGLSWPIRSVKQARPSPQPSARVDVHAFRTGSPADRDSREGLCKPDQSCASLCTGRAASGPRASGSCAPCEASQRRPARSVELTHSSCDSLLNVASTCEKRNSSGALTWAFGSPSSKIHRGRKSQRQCPCVGSTPTRVVRVDQTTGLDES